jgi:hypothetical protein
MSRWCEENISTSHDHKWEMISRSTTTRGFLTVTSIQDRLPRELVWLDSAAVVYILDQLRKHDLHEEYFALLTSDDQGIRLAAVDACASFPYSGSTDVAGWWSALQRAIGDDPSKEGRGTER